MAWASPQGCSSVLTAWRPASPESVAQGARRTQCEPEGIVTLISTIPTDLLGVLGVLCKDVSPGSRGHWGQAGDGGVGGELGALLLSGG